MLKRETSWPPLDARVGRGVPTAPFRTGLTARRAVPTPRSTFASESNVQLNQKTSLDTARKLF